MKSKYVIMQDCSESNYVFVIDSTLMHVDIKRAFPNWKVVSAGFCSIDSANSDDPNYPIVDVWGESLSLGVKSRPEDSRILSQHLSCI